MTNIYFKRNAKVFNDEFISKKEKDLSDLYNYLQSRDFTYFPSLIERKDTENRYEYIEDFSIDNNQKSIDLIDAVSLLHNKTSFKKEISPSKNKHIYRDMKGYIRYLDTYYDSLLTSIEEIEYPSPSEQLFLNNYSKLYECLRFLDSEIDNWYKLVKEKTSERVSMIHGKLSLDHILKNNKTHLISWDKSRIETPIVDIVRLYHKEWDKIDFKNVLERYLTKCELSESEKKLLFINITIPVKFTLNSDEVNNTIELNRFFEYIYKTEDLIRPYYSKEQEKE